MKSLLRKRGREKKNNPGTMGFYCTVGTRVSKVKVSSYILPLCLTGSVPALNPNLGVFL